MNTLLLANIAWSFGYYLALARLATGQDKLCYSALTKNNLWYLRTARRSTRRPVRSDWRTTGEQIRKGMCHGARHAAHPLLQSGIVRAELGHQLAKDWPNSGA